MTDISQAQTLRMSEEFGDVATALAEAQGAFPEVKKERTAKVSGKKADGNYYNYEYKYADLSDVLTAILPVLSKNKLALIQPTVLEGGTMFIRTRLIHGPSGQWMESEYPVSAMNRSHQDMGGSLSYARRYAACSLLGIAPEEDIEEMRAEGGKPVVDKKAERPARPAPTVVQPAPEPAKDEGQKPLPPRAGLAQDLDEARLHSIIQGLAGVTSVEQANVVLADKGYDPWINELLAIDPEKGDRMREAVNAAMETLD